MNDKVNREPAYPGIVGVNGYGGATPTSLPDGRVEWIEHAPGMTLRDYFAAQALVAVAKYFNIHSDSADVIAEYSYRLADAMLAERRK
jgi:hypothetical protein